MAGRSGVPRPAEPPSAPPLEGEGLLEGLLPPFVRGVAARIRDSCTSPFPEESAAVARAVESRRREFLCGRACAREALRALGVEPAPILIGARREPLWPPGVVGSIAHARSLVAAVVARAADAWGLGLDIEAADSPLAPEVERLVLTAAERSRAARLAAALPAVSAVVFGAKECVYKCLFPRTGWRPDFGDVDVRVDPGGGRWRAELHPSAVADAGIDPASLPGRLEGAFRVAGGYAITALCVDAAPISSRPEPPRPSGRASPAG